jgi:hypothetical protein
MVGMLFFGGTVLGKIASRILRNLQKTAVVCCLVIVKRLVFLPVTFLQNSNYIKLLKPMYYPNAGIDL